MASASPLVAHLLDLLGPRVAARRMFSGWGLFRGRLMFGLVSDETLYLKTDAGNRPDFESAGMPPFRYRRGARTVALGYHAAPPDLLDDGEALERWADGAFEAALRAAREKAPARTGRRG